MQRVELEGLAHTGDRLLLHPAPDVTEVGPLLDVDAQLEPRGVRVVVCPAVALDSARAC